MVRTLSKFLVEHSLSRFVPRHVIVIPIIAATAMIVVVISVWQMVKADQESRFNADTRSNAEHFAARLEAHIATRIDIGDHIRRQWLDGQITNQIDFQSRTFPAHDFFRDFQAINWVDPSGVIRWVTPYKGNEAALGLNVRKLSVPAAALAEAERSGKMQVTPPIILAQGGPGFVAYIPLTKNGLSEGFLNIVFRTGSLIEGAFGKGIGGKFHLMVTDGGKAVYRAGKMPEIGLGQIDKQVNVGNRVWTVSVMPTTEHAAKYSSIIDDLVLGLGLILSVATAGLIWLVLLRQATLRASEFRLKKAQEIARIGNFELDSRTNDVIYCSDVISEIYGLPLDAAPGTFKGSLDIIHPEDRERVGRIFEATARTKKPYDVDYRIVRPDGEIRHVREMSEYQFDDKGTLVRSSGLFQDITALKQTENALRQAQKMEAVGQLTGGVAHDFNNLLAIMLGNAEFLAERFHDDETAQYDIQAILSAIDRATSLTRRLLAFSRQTPLSPKPTDISNLVSDIGDLLQRAAGENVSLKVLCNTELWPAIIDASQLEHVLINLAVNARHAMPEGGELVIETDNAMLNDHDVRQSEELTAGDYVKITIRDTGTGMPPEILKRAIEPFFTTKEVGEGSGLGLSMVYGYMKQSGGHMEINSEVGCGTVVELYLPASKNAVIEKNIPQSEESMAHGVETVLVVEDDDIVRKIPVAILRNQGYEVLEAKNAEDAIECLKSDQSFDLLFSDVILPGSMNGIDIAQAGKRLQPKMQILYTTGYTENSVMHEARLDPGVNLLSKPYHKEELLKKVRAVLEART